jgi:2-methylisocitrate lyase-like PEP mutase family enzyme
MTNVVEGGRTPLLTVAELHALGFVLITFSGTLQKAALKAWQLVLRTLAQTGDPKSFFPEHVLDLDARSELLDLKHWEALAEAYATRTEGSGQTG